MDKDKLIEQDEEKEELERLLSDDFFIPYQRACDIVFHRLNLINLNITEEEGREIVHYFKKRIKSPSSIYKKMNTRKKRLDDIKDIAGLRIVVHNKKDAYTFLKKIKKDETIKVKHTDDMILKPKNDGYRSLHLKTEVEINEKSEKSLKIPCEIQIRSIAEDLWATLSHREIYKDVVLPKKLQRKMYELSNLLDGADSFAETLIELIEEEKDKGKLPDFDIDLDIFENLANRIAVSSQAIKRYQEEIHSSISKDLADSYTKKYWKTKNIKYGQTKKGKKTKKK